MTAPLRPWRGIVSALACLAFSTNCAADANPPWQLDLVVRGSSFHGVHGLAFNSRDELFAASILGQSIYQVDRAQGSARSFVDPPFGQSDGLIFGPDGALVWSAFIDGEVRALAPDKSRTVLASELLGAAAVGFRGCNAEQRRLYAATALAGGALLEIGYPSGSTRNLGPIAGLTGFDFGCDGKLYGALVTTGQVVRIDVDQSPLQPTPIACGFRAPSDVKFDAKGDLYVLDAGTGEILRVNPDNGTKTVVAQGPTTLDKMAFDAQGRLFASVPADNAIIEVNVATGAVRTIIDGPLAAPSDIAIVRDGAQEWLYVADTFSLKRVDLTTGHVESLARLWENDWTLGTHIAARDSTVVVGSWATQSIQILDRHSGGRTAFVENMGLVQDVLMLPDGSVLYAQFFPGQIFRMNRKGGERVMVTGNLNGPTGLAQGPGSSVYITETIGGRLLRLDMDTQTLTPIATALQNPEGLAVMKDGRIAVAEVGKHRLIAVDASSGEIEVLRDNLPIGLALTHTLVPLIVIPTGVAVDADGNVYFSSDLENAIYRLTPGRSKSPQRREP
jgi:sugar lactone lactonase YvrE